ncbi:MAG: sodium-dependent transporter [Methanoregula sp.]|nr:sodium-dependent transporter [Methanoregula sp.]
MERWSSNLGFILATVGAAVGIGNIWRFSSLVGENGGGAFLIPYLIAVFIVALPLMILEITMGRRFRGTVVSSFAALRPEFRILGWLICAVVFLILSYYIVITGWTLAYATFSALGTTTTFAAFTGSYIPVIFGIIAIVLTGIVVSFGIQKGIERIAITLVPLMIGILILMAVFCATLSGFWDAVLFIFTPDFSVLSRPDLWVAAFGQAFFSLSVGEGILLTYGAYLSKDEDILKSATIITVADTAIALLAGVIIFSIVFTFGLAPTAGTQLAFTTLPLAFALMPAGYFVAIAFFVVLFVAAFTSAISLLEVCVASVQETSGWSRTKTATILTAILLLVSLGPALSYSAAQLSLWGIPVLDFMDETIGTLGLYFTAIIIAVAFTWFLPPKTDGAKPAAGSAIKRAVFFVCKYIIPVTMVILIVLHMIMSFDPTDATYLIGKRYVQSFVQMGGVFITIAGIYIMYLLIKTIRK